MANIPGLSPIRDDTPQDVRRDKQGVEIPGSNLKAPGLRPQAQPVEIYSRPAVVQGDNTLTDLARSLEGLNPALARFGSAYMEANKDKQKEADEAFASKARINKQSMTPEDFGKWASSDPEAATKFGKAALRKVNGDADAQSFVDGLTTSYQNEFPKDGTGDINSFIAGKLAPLREKYKDQPEALKAIMDNIEPTLSKLRSGYSAQQSQQNFDDNIQKLGDGLYSDARSAADSGASVEDQGKAILNSITTSSKFLKLSREDQYRAINAVGEKLAREGNFKLLGALAKSPVKMPDGETRTILEDNTLGGKFFDLINNSKQLYEKKNHETGVDFRMELDKKAREGALSEADNHAIMDGINNGSLPEDFGRGLIHANEAVLAKKQAAASKALLLENRDKLLNNQETNFTGAAVSAVVSGKVNNLGSVVVLKKEGEYGLKEEEQSSDDTVKKAWEAYDKWSSREAQTPKVRDSSGLARPETWSETFDREVKDYTANGHVPDKWIKLASDGANSLSAATNGGGGMTEATQRGYEMFAKMKANNSQAIGKVFPGDTGTAFEAIHQMVKDNRMTLPEAVATYQRRAADPLSQNARVDRRTLNESLSGGIYDKGSTHWWFGYGKYDVAGSPIQGVIEQRADELKKRGATDKEAIDGAIAQVQANYVNVNGAWIDTSDRSIPPDFTDIMTGLIQERFNKLGADNGLHDVSDISIRKATGGKDGWVLVDRVNGIPLQGDTSPVITGRDIMRLSAKRKADSDAAAAAQAQKDAEDSMRPWAVWGNPDKPRAIGPFFPTGFSKWPKAKQEQYLKLREQGRKDALGKKIEDSKKPAGFVTPDGGVVPGL
ncbi:hypothetical protein [Labrys neptuniae]